MPGYVEERVEQAVAELRNRGFGDIPLRADAAMAPFSRASMQAAANLLAKATQALHEGDRERATRYVARAVALPYDEVEEAAPVAWEAHMALFNAITDELETAAEDDETWLDAALVVLDSGSRAVRFELRYCLATIDHDYRLSKREAKRLRAAIAGVPARPELIDLDLPSEELTALVLGILDLTIAYEEALG